MTETRVVDTEVANVYDGTQTVSDNDTDDSILVADTNDETIGSPDTTVYVYIDDNGEMYTPGGEFLGSGLTSTGITTVSDTTSTTDRTTSDTNNWDASDTDRETVADDTLFPTTDRDNDTDATLAGTTTGTAGGSDIIRGLAILAMVLGAILTILGLVLPNRHVDVEVDRSARTQGVAGRRVYEREEIKREERRR